MLPFFTVQHSSVAKVADYNLFDLTAKSDWLPIRWLAPETLKYRKHNEKSDMWSYGESENEYTVELHCPGYQKILSIVRD